MGKQMKELEMQHQLRERERELECNLHVLALEEDDVCSQSAKACFKSLFNWPTTKRCLGIGQYDEGNTNTSSSKNAV